MSRRHAAKKRDVLPDPKYKSIKVAKLINTLMEDGKKSVAERIVYDALDIVATKTKRSGEEVYIDVLEKVRPLVEVKSRRVGGATYQVPVEVRLAAGERKANGWLALYARKRGEKTMSAKLAGELLDALNERGGSIKKREETHKQAEANRAFAHFRW